MSSPSRQPTGRTLLRAIWSHDLSRAAVVVAIGLCVTVIGAAALIDGFRDSSAALADAKDRRAQIEDLDREATRIEITGWRIWRSEGEFTLTPQTALRALALVDETRVFYEERALVGSSREVEVSRRALSVLDGVPELVGAASPEGAGRVDLAAALARFPEFTQEQEAIHGEWLAINRSQISEYEGHRDRWAWAGLAALAGLVVLLSALTFFLFARNARLQRETIDQLRRQAVTDALTGLINQGEFHQRLEAAVARAREHREPLSVVVLDVDHFKRVNDAYGHQVGDGVLAEIAARILEVSRGHDCVGRVGGEEFAWILPRVVERDALDAADRAREAVASHAVIEAGDLTLSAGVAELEPGVDAVGLYRRADLALYRAKERGRDIAVCHSFGEEAGRGPRILSR